MGAALRPLAVIIGAAFGAVLGPIAASSTGFGELSWAFAAVGGSVGYLAYWYSPLPQHNGGWGLGPAKMQQWGFTTEPRQGYEGPESGELLQPALKGINLARAKEESEETDDGENHG